MANPNVWIAALGLVVIVVLLVKKVHGAILIGIITSTIFAGFLGTIQLPQGSWITLPPSIEPIFFKFEWNSIFTFDMLIVVFTFLMVNIFDAMGTLIGVISKIGKSEKDGSFPQLQKALFADALGTFVGAVLGTSPNTSYVESASGVAAGGRTGLTSVSTTLMFVLAEISEGLPAFVTIIFMPFTYSIANGIIFGMLSFTIIKLLSGRAKEVSITMYVLTLFFLIKIFLDASNAFVH